MDTIELEPSQRLEVKIRRFLLKTSALILTLMLAFIGVRTATHEFINWAHPKVVQAKFELGDALGLVRNETVIVKVSDLESDRIIEMRSEKYGLLPVLGYAMKDQESAGKPFRFRFEQSWKDQYSKKFPQGNLNTEEWNLYFSSIGLMQISYAIWGDFCGVDSPVALFDTTTNIDCAIRIMAQCWYDMRNTKDKAYVAQECFRKYNGSGPRAVAYAQQMMARVSGHILNDPEMLKQGVLNAAVYKPSEDENKQIEVIHTEVSDLGRSLSLPMTEPVKYQVVDKSVKPRVRKG